MTSTAIGPRWMRRALATVAALALIGAGLTSGRSVASAATDLPDGSSPERAAASCWEIRQNDPGSPDGTYWLVTPTLVAPAQFYCDMTTDGGGWVLVGRGRDAWKEHYTGLRPERMLTAVTGPAAFQPSQLPASTIDGLLDGGRVDALADGIRVRRAAAADGSAWQEVRLRPSSRDRWTWTFGAEHGLRSFSFNGSSRNGGLTSDFGADQGLRRVRTGENSAMGYRAGWAYGDSVTGSSSETSYLWSRTNGQGRALPFAQVYLRPTLRLSDLAFPTIPDEGAPAQEQRRLPQSQAMPTVWGVTGLAAGSGELNTEVQAFAQVGQTVYVGGNFSQVQRDSAGRDVVARRFLAGFDVSTGELVTSFAPVLDGQVKALAALPDGRLAVGGTFTTVDGQARPGLAFLDPVTGALQGWQVEVQNRSASGALSVRGMSVSDTHLYLSGSMTHLLSGTTTASTWNAGRIRLSDGRPDTAWNPALNGTSVGVHAAEAGDRVYYSGYFRQTGTIPTTSASAVLTGSGASVVEPVWSPTFSRTLNDNLWQLGVTEASGRVYLGGSEHSLFGYDREGFALRSGSITKAGGDFQTVVADGDLVYGGCHCGHWVFQDSYAWPTLTPGWTQADQITTIGAWDAASGTYLPEFNPVLKGRAGYGAWASFVDSTGVLWVGGDYVSSLRANYVNQWSGGFARFAPRDVTAPSAPTSLLVTAGAQLELTWDAEAGGGVARYEVLRDGRVIAIPTTTSTSVALPQGVARYAVRAVDAAGNRSATTPVQVVDPATIPVSTTFVAAGSTWSWRFDTTAPAEGWTQLGHDDSGWATGEAVLGYGSSSVSTDISVGAPTRRPLSAQFRHEFTVSDPGEYGTVDLTLLGNDGAVVWLNGTEVARVNLPTGPITSTTLATAAPPASAPPVTISVPAALLTEGDNVLAAQTHLNYRSTPNVLFDLSLVGTEGPAVAPDPPAAASLQALATSPSTVELAWEHVPGDYFSGYVLERDGAVVAELGPDARAHTDEGLEPGSSHSYTVSAVDAFGQATPSQAAEVTLPEPVPDPVVLVAEGSSWSWRFDAAPLAEDWVQAAFDDQGWAVGSAVLGYGSSKVSTDLKAGAPTPRPLSVQFRHEFTVDDPSGLGATQLTFLANDGAVVWLNGTEVARVNLPTGPLTQNTFATAAPGAGAAPVTVAVPPGLLVAGQNVVTAQTHLNYRNSPNILFDLEAEEVPPAP
ncbi:fibrinogen-like YCDxxxxGGGW domain-containing protein [Ornithinimicrobium panacihumi]|uniref:fibrinogen-like YCDxxxxGGGW domain-containing protein n=1 Tax=Ornithinimicrobium panacihumi TaxID=2008449 RepID=UPI003F886F25